MRVRNCCTEEDWLEMYSSILHFSTVFHFLSWLFSFLSIYFPLRTCPFRTCKIFTFFSASVKIGDVKIIEILYCDCVSVHNLPTCREFSKGKTVLLQSFSQSRRLILQRLIVYRKCSSRETQLFRNQYQVDERSMKIFAGS